MNVLFVSDFYAPHVGGGELVVQRLAEALARRGHEVTVVTTRLPQTAKREEMNGVTVIRTGAPWMAPRSFFTLTALPITTRLARRADVVHTIPYNAAPPAWLAASVAATARIITVFEVMGERWRLVEGDGWRARVHRLAERSIVRLPFDAWVAISEATRRDLAQAGVDPARTSVIYCGVDRDVFTPRPGRGVAVRAALGLRTSEFVYLYFGRPGITKGLPSLVAAVPEIQRRIPEARAVFVLGSEPAAEYRRVMREIAALAPPSRPLVVDSVARDRLPDYIAAADCVVVPSLTEGFGLAAAEACAMDVPVVATSAGSLPEVVSGRFVLVEPGSAAALADGVAMIAAGRYQSTPPKAFSWDRAADDYLALYKAVSRTRSAVPASV